MKHLKVMIFTVFGRAAAVFNGTGVRDKRCSKRWCG